MSFEAAITPPNGLSMAGPATIDEKGRIVVAMRTERTEAHCACGGRFRRHGHRWGIVADRPVDGRPVRLAVRYARLRCRRCLTSRRETIASLDGRHRMTGRLVEFVAAEAQSRSVLSISRSIGLDEKTVRNALADYLASTLDQEILSIPQILGIAKVESEGRAVTTFWDVGTRRVIDAIPTVSSSAVRQWIEAVPQRELILVVVTDLVDAYFQAARKALPRAIAAVHSDDVTQRLKAAARQIREQSRFKRFRKDDVYFAQFGSLGQTLFDVNPFFRRALEARRAYHRIWRDREPLTVVHRLDQLVETLPPDVRRTVSDVVRLVRKWKHELAASVCVPGLSRGMGYATARSRIAKANFARNWRMLAEDEPFSDKVTLCAVCLKDRRSWQRVKMHGGLARGGLVPKRFRNANARSICIECNRPSYSTNAMQKWPSMWGISGHSVKTQRN